MFMASLMALSSITVGARLFMVLPIIPPLTVVVMSLLTVVRLPIMSLLIVAVRWLSQPHQPLKA